MKKVIGYIIILILFAGSIAGIVFGIKYKNVNDEYQNSNNIEYVQQLEQTIEDLTNYQEELLLQIDNLTKENQEYISRNEDLNNTVTTLTGQVDNLTKQIEEYTVTIEENNTTISSLEEEIDALKNDNSENQTLINELNEQIESLQSQNATLQETIDNHLVTISTLNGTIETLNLTIENLKDDKNSLQQSINELTSQVSNLEQEIENYESIIETLQRENFATVIFKIENEVVSTQSIKKGTHPTEIEDERLNDESFKGWVIENTSDIVDPYTCNIEQNITFVAHFEKTSYQVTFKVNNAIVDTQTVNVGQYATDYVVSETEDYVFDYWTVNGVKVDNVSTYQINADTEFVAVLKYYKTVTYKVAGQEDYAVKVLEGNKIEEKYVPTFTNNTYFAGWEYNNQLIDETNFLVVDNIVLNAKLNYINSSYHFVSLVDYNTPDLDTKTLAHRVTIDFEIKDNQLVSFDLYVEMKGPTDIWIETLNYSFNWLDSVEFDKKTQEIKVNVSFDVDSSYSSEAIETLKSYGFNSLLNLDLKYNSSDNTWEMFDYMECWGTTSKMLLGQTQNIEFVVGESQTTIKED